MTSKMMTVRQAAELWQISPRRVQDLCRQGRVTGAVLFGKNWMIPGETRRPEDGRSHRHLDDVKPLPRRSPLLCMTDLYHTPGCAAAASAGLNTHPEAKALFDGGIAYCRGDIDTAYRFAKGFLAKRSGFYAVTGAGLLLSFCAIWRGDADLWEEAMYYITRAPVRTEAEREHLSLVLTVANGGLMDFREYPDWFERGNFERIPADSHPAAKVFYARYLYATGYGVASRIITLPDITGLGLMRILPNTIESMITQAVVDKTVIPEIHLRLWCAAAYHNSGQDEFAIPHVDRAIALALPDRLFGILAEHNRSMDSLLEERLALQEPSAVKTLREIYRTYFTGQSVLRGRISNRTIALNLTTREREIAKMAAFGMTNRAIAKRLGIGESTVKSTIQSIMQKTGNTDPTDFVLSL